MFKIVEFLKKRPTDKQMRIWRTIFGLIIIFLLGFYFNDFSFNFEIWNNENYIKYSLFILWIIPIIMWLTDICFAKRKYVKIIQIIFWLVLIFVWNNIEMNSINSDIKTVETQSWSLNLSDLTSTSSSKNQSINIGIIIAWMWILPIIMWITGKCISQKCYKFGEKITKIRV